MALIIILINILLKFRTLKQKCHDTIDTSTDEPEENWRFKTYAGKWLPHKPADIYENLSSVTEIKLSATENGDNVSLNARELEIYNDRCKALGREDKSFTKLYGNNFLEAHTRIVLLPLRLHLNNDKVVWLNAVLYVFTNKMGVLKLELPLVNVVTKPLLTIAPLNI